MKDVTRGNSKVPLEVTGGVDLDARLAIGITHEAIGDWFGQD
jgi:hypothetical protein